MRPVRTKLPGLLVCTCVCWSPFAHASFVTFDVPGSLNTYLTGINDSGWIVGTSNLGPSDSSGVIIKPDGTFTIFHEPESQYGTFVWDINNNNEIVGTFSGDGRESGFYRSAGGNFVRLDAPGAKNTQAFGINDMGEIVGTYQSEADLSQHGFLRDATGTYFSFTVQSPANATTPYDISNTGHIVGDSSYAPERGFYGTLNNGFELFSAITGFETIAYGLNNMGDIVGTLSGGGSEQGFVLRSDSIVQTYSCGGHTRFYDVNIHGSIVGTCWGGSGGVSGLIGALDTSTSGTIPEPTTASLLIPGSVWLGIAYRRRIRAQSTKT